MREIGKTVYLVIGWVGLALAVIGTLLPVMPTVPFLIVAFWGFSQSSPRLTRRILANPVFGPPLRDWLRYRAIPRRIKHGTTLAMALGCALGWWLGLPLWMLAVQGTICLLAAAYILTRPDPPAAA